MTADGDARVWLGRAKRPAGRAQPVLAWTVVHLLLAGALLAPALWNGFPIVWADSGGYLARPFEGTLEIGRSALYGLLLAAGSRLDLWPAVVLQALATAFVLLLALRVYGLRERPWSAAALALALAALTSVPFFASQLMPDIFLPLAVLALHLLAFRRAALRVGEKAALMVLIALAIACHMTILALSLALVLAFTLQRVSPLRLRLQRPSLTAPAVAVALGVALALVSNLAIGGRVAFTPGATHFVFGRLVQDGIIARYLDERCPRPGLRLCAYRSALPNTADGWLWGWDSPYYRLGGAEGFEPEARRIIADTLLMYPGQHLVTAGRAALHQLVMVKTGEGIHARDLEHALRALDRYVPAVMPRYHASRQQRDEFGFATINAVQMPLALIASALLPLLVIGGYLGRVDRAAAVLALTVLLALLVNAAICGALSNPNDRYQSRIVWLAPLAVMIAALRRQKAHHAGVMPPRRRGIQ